MPLTRTPSGAMVFVSEYGLLTRDSIILAIMERHKLIHLVTKDRDFEQVPGIKVWLP